MNTKRLLLLGALIAAIAAFFIFDLKQIFSVEYFQAQRMRTISYGKERPVAVCNDISCWSQNRRVVTVLNTSS